MIEKLSKALQYAWMIGDDADKLPPLVFTDAESAHLVRAVLQALMEPTPEMCEAAWLYSQSDPNEAKGCWQEMLKEAMRSA